MLSLYILNSLELIFYQKIYFYFVCVCGALRYVVCVCVCAHAHTCIVHTTYGQLLKGQKEGPNPLALKLQQSVSLHGSWEANSDSLEEQCALLTAEPSLHFLRLFS